MQSKCHRNEYPFLRHLTYIYKEASQKIFFVVRQFSFIDTSSTINLAILLFSYFVSAKLSSRKIGHTKKIAFRKSASDLLEIIDQGIYL